MALIRGFMVLWAALAMSQPAFAYTEYICGVTDGSYIFGTRGPTKASSGAFALKMCRKHGAHPRRCDSPYCKKVILRKAPHPPLALLKVTEISTGRSRSRPGSGTSSDTSSDSSSGSSSSSGSDRKSPSKYCEYRPSEPGCPQYCEARPMDPSCRNSARYCEYHPYEPGCPQYCDSRPMDPSCRNSDRYCEYHPYEPGCPQWCESHSMDPRCKY